MQYAFGTCIVPINYCLHFQQYPTIETTGLRRNDPRLEPCRKKFEEKKEASKSEGDFKVNRAEFSEWVSEIVELDETEHKNFNLMQISVRTFAVTVRE